MALIMDDCSEELLAWMMAQMPQDAGVIAAFAPSAARVFDAPPVGAKGDYVILGPIHIIPVDGSDAGNAEATIDIWSLTDPPGNAKARRIGRAVQAFCLTLADLPSHLVKAVRASSTQYLTDPGDARTAHGIVKIEFVTQPKP